MEEKKELNQEEMTLEQMQDECVKCAFEIARLSSIINNHQKRFDYLHYEIWKQTRDNNEPIVSANSEDNK